MSRPLSLRRQPPAGVLVATGIVSVQFGAAIATHLFHKVGPAGAVTLRLVLAAVALAAINRPWRTFAEGLRHRRNDLAVVVAFGLILGGMNLAFYEALSRVPLGVAVTVEFVGPLAVTIAASRRRTDVLWALLAAAGVFLLAGGEIIGGVHRLNTVGVLLALVAGACWAAYILLAAQTGRRFQGTSGLAIAMVIGALAVIPFGALQAGTRLFAPEVAALGLAVALLSSVVPYTFELLALRRLSPRAFGILLSLEPAIAALAGLAVLGQHLSWSQIVALVMVVLANAGSTWFDSRGQRRLIAVGEP